MKIEEEIKQAKFRNAFHKVAVNLLFTAAWLEDRNKQYFKVFSLTPQQFNILRILRGQYPGRISVAEIKFRMLDKNSDVSRLVGRLITKKLAIKNQSANDKRATDVSISEAGLVVLDKIDRKMDQVDARLFKITKDEARILSDLLDKSRGGE